MKNLLLTFFKRINKIELKKEKIHQIHYVLKEKINEKKPKIESSIYLNKTKKKSIKTFEDDELNNMSF